MRIYEPLQNWHGMPVLDWDPGDTSPRDFSNTIFRLRYIPPVKTGLFRRVRTEAPDVFGSFLSSGNSEQTRGLILSSSSYYGGDVASDIKLLLEAKDQLPNLRYLFLGELTSEDCEISWIQQGNITPVLEAFPGLEELSVRGSADLHLKESRHICLKKLIIESSGLNAEDIFPGLHQSIFPELEHLELWAGTEDYGWSGTVEDFRPFLYQNPFPKLKFLGLKNSDLQNEIARMAADAPVLDQLETLDLSLGSLRDSGAQALLESDKINRLKNLNLSHHFMSDEMVENFRNLKVNVDVTGQEQPGDDFEDDELNYYVAVGE